MTSPPPSPGAGRHRAGRASAHTANSIRVRIPGLELMVDGRNVLDAAPLRRGRRRIRGHRPLSDAARPRRPDGRGGRAAAGRACRRSRRVGRRAHLQRDREPRARPRGDPRGPAAGRRSSSSTTGRRTGPDSSRTRSPPGSTRLHVLHRSTKDGLGAAYSAAFRWVLDRPEAEAVVQMDADLSHDPADLPRLLAPLMRDADLVLGTRYLRGGGTIGWPWYRHLISRGGDVRADRAAPPVPRPDRWLQGLAPILLESIRLRDAGANGYGFQVEMTWWAHRRGRTDRPGPDRLPRAPGGPLQDVGRHRPRGALRRPCAALGRDPGGAPRVEPRRVIELAAQGRRWRADRPSGRMAPAPGVHRPSPALWSDTSRA